MNLNALIIEAMSGNFVVLSAFLEKLNIKALRVQNLDGLNSILESGLSVSVAIIDIMGFDDKIWEFCKAFKKKDIPMLIISPSNRSEILKTSSEYGAKGILLKPVLMQELAAYIRSLIPKE